MPLPEPKAPRTKSMARSGAVAVDAAGHLAAATSAGGYNTKPDGRVGYSSVIGAGTYARDGVCAVEFGTSLWSDHRMRVLDEASPRSRPSRRNPKDPGSV